MQKMNIAFLDFDDLKNPLLGAGQARATYEVGSRLAAMGHKVTVYCSRYPGYRDRTYHGITYKHIALGSKHLRLNNALYILSIPYYARQIKADVIIESFTAPVSTLLTPLFTNIPVIGLPSMFNAKEFSQKYGLPFHLWESLGSKVYKYFLPYSDVDSAKMKKLNPRIRYQITPQGVDESFFKIPHKKPKHILFLSRFEIHQKGIDLLLRSYAKVAKKIGYPLVLAGHGNDTQKIKELISELGLEDKVSFAGSAYGKKKEKLISEAVFVAFPSRHDEISLWALEALASGMPLVGFDLPECKWITAEASLKAKPFDLDAYAKLLLKATDKKVNDKMRKEARILAKHYSWDKVAGMFDDFIVKVVRYEKNKNLSMAMAK